MILAYKSFSFFFDFFLLLKGKILFIEIKKKKKKKKKRKKRKNKNQYTCNRDNKQTSRESKLKTNCRKSGNKTTGQYTRSKSPSRQDNKWAELLKHNANPITTPSQPEAANSLELILADDSLYLNIAFHLFFHCSVLDLWIKLRSFYCIISYLEICQTLVVTNMKVMYQSKLHHVLFSY